MDIVTIIRVTGFACVGLGIGYWGSAFIRRAAASKTICNRRFMAIVCGLIGVSIAAASITFTPAPAAPLQTLTTNIDLDRALATSAGTPIVVDFYADWCPPCRDLSPKLEELQRKWGGRILFYKVNVDEATELKRRFTIRSIPTMIYFQDGEEVDRTIGLVSTDQIESRMEAMIEKAGESQQLASQLD